MIVTAELKLRKYVQAINEIAKKQISHYKAKSIMDDSPFYDEYKIKIDALQEFIKESKLDNWAEGLLREENTTTKG